MALAKLYFTASNGLWVTDGTAAGTYQLPTASHGFNGLNPSHFAVANGKVLFSGFDGGGKVNLWTVDPTTNAATELTVPNAGTSVGLSPSKGQAYNGKVYFAGYDAAGLRTLWSTDGTAAGTGELILTGLSGSSFYPEHLTTLGSNLVFSAEPSTVVTGLYTSDGTAPGTSELSLPGTSFIGPQVSSLASLGAKLVFGGLDSASKNRLWVSDGTAAGTSVLAVPRLNPSGGYTGRVAGLLAFGGDKAAFTAVDASGTSRVWVTDGTVAGTVELPGATTASYGTPMVALPGNRLAFVGTDVSGRSGIWLTDGTIAGTAPLSVPGANAAGLMPNAVMADGDVLYFDGITTTGAHTLFASDGTSAGTHTVATGISLVSGNIDTDAAAVGGTVAYTDAATGQSAAPVSDAYSGPVSYLQSQYIWTGTDNVALRADAPSTFLKGGAGDDALQVAGGNNVLDGGAGSNFLIGDTGADGGNDTFFVDGRGNAVTWSTIVNFHPGDQATIFGFHGSLSTASWVASDGVSGYQGVTLHSELGGSGTGVNASMTFAGIDGATAATHFVFTGGTLASGTADAVDYLLIQYKA